MVDRRQVVRICAGRFVGTGFLIAPDKLATALHVVVELDDEENVKRDTAGQPIPLSPITCEYFSDSREYWQEEGITFDPDRDDYDIDEDWVVLPVEQAPAEAVWSGRPLVSGDQGATCRSYGFSVDLRAVGTPLHGEITGVGDPWPLGTSVIRLHRAQFDETVSLTGLRLHGVSGGPVVVDGRVVGLIRWSIPARAKKNSTMHDRSLAGTPFIVPIERLPIGLWQRSTDERGEVLREAIAQRTLAGVNSSDLRGGPAIRFAPAARLRQRQCRRIPRRPLPAPRTARTGSLRGGLARLRSGPRRIGGRQDPPRSVVRRSHAGRSHTATILTEGRRPTLPRLSPVPGSPTLAPRQSQAGDSALEASLVAISSRRHR